MAGERYVDVFAGPMVKGPSNATRIQGDPAGGLWYSQKGGAITPLLAPQQILEPVWPGNPLFDFNADNIDLLGNSPNQRPIVQIATDNVVAASHTWTFANGAFTQADVGRVLTVAGATNAANNATFIIQSVTNATTIVTTGTQTNETFANAGNLLIAVVGINAGLIDGAIVPAWLNSGSFQASSGPLFVPIHAIRSAGNIQFRKLWNSGRAGNLSSVHSDGLNLASMATQAITALATPVIVACVCSFDSLTPSGANFCPVDGVGAGRSGFYVNAATGAIHMIGAGDYQTTLAVAGNQINCMVGFFNAGATCFTNLNGLSQSALGTCTPAGMTGVTLFSFVGAAGAFHIGDIFRVSIWDANIMASVYGSTANAIATIQAAAAAKWGALPQ